MIQFTVHCVPVPQPRQRTRAFIDGAGNAMTQNYTPAKHPANVFKAAVAVAYWAESRRVAPVDGPVSLSLVFILPRPKSMTKKRGPNPRVPDARKTADIDNLSKCVMDALNGVAWLDDCQVQRICASKWIASADESPRAEVTIASVSEVTKETT